MLAYILFACGNLRQIELYTGNKSTVAFGDYNNIAARLCHSNDNHLPVLNGPLVIYNICFDDLLHKTSLKLSRILTTHVMRLSHY